MDIIKKKYFFFFKLKGKGLIFKLKILILFILIQMKNINKFLNKIFFFWKNQMIFF